MVALQAVYLHNLRQDIWRQQSWPPLDSEGVPPRHGGQEPRPFPHSSLADRIPDMRRGHGLLGH